MAMDFSFLNGVSKLIEFIDLSQLFQKCIAVIETFLELPAIKTEISIEIVDISSFENESVFDIGVLRKSDDGGKIIEISRKYLNFLPFIILRESFNCFTPNDVMDNDNVKTIINSIVKVTLGELMDIEDWNDIVSKKVLSFPILKGHMERADEFFRQESSGDIEHPVKYFFKYIRRHSTLINSLDANLYDIIHKKYYFESLKYLEDDTIIETIHALIKILWECKIFRSLKEIKNQFTEFKKSEKIKTTLSLKQFSESIEEINAKTNIGPSYQVNWRAFGCERFVIDIRFHPIIKRGDVEKVFKHMPFFLSMRSNASSFSINLIGYLIVPFVYVKDLRSVLINLKNLGHVIDVKLYNYQHYINIINLNYFKSHHVRNTIFNPRNKFYNPELLMEFKMQYEKRLESSVSMLTHLLIERSKNFSLTGFSFQRLATAAERLREDRDNIFITQKNFLNDLKDAFETFHENDDLHGRFEDFLKKVKGRGVFYIHDLLKRLNKSITITEDIIKKPEINSHLSFREFIKDNHFSDTIEGNILLNEDNIKNFILKSFSPLYFKNKVEFNRIQEDFKFFLKFFEVCLNLKILNLNLIRKISSSETSSRNIQNEKLRKIMRKEREIKKIPITNKFINSNLLQLIESKPIGLKPKLTTTFSVAHLARYYIALFFNDTPVVREKIQNFKLYIPRLFYNFGFGEYTNQKLIWMEVYFISLNKREKALFMNTLTSIFKDDLISVRSFFYDGLVDQFNMLDYFDHDKDDYFYTRDLFEQFFLLARNTFSEDVKPFQESPLMLRELLWSLGKEKDELTMDNLARSLSKRVSQERNDLPIKKISELAKFHRSLISRLTNEEAFKVEKTQEFYKDYIKSISFIPSFPKFGLAQYYLYVRPINMANIDWKLLLGNTFQGVQHPAYIDSVNSLLIKYIFPHRNPNTAYLNVISKSLKLVSEYCLFYIKKTHIILHFDSNLHSDGWELDAFIFKAFAQKLLHSPKYRYKTPHIQTISHEAITREHWLSPHSPEFKDLCNAYSFKRVNLGAMQGVGMSSCKTSIQNLLKRNLIFPYLKLRNMGFQQVLKFLLVDVEKNQIPKLIQLFSFFNHVFIHEIEGDYFLHGFDKKKMFDSGLFIKIFLPPCRTEDFQSHFHLIFEDLGIERYVIFNDMVSGTQFIGNVFGDGSFLEKYNPLKNLDWNEVDQRWMNPKTYGEGMVPIYPNLLKGLKKTR